MIIKITPQPKPRMVKSDKWKQRPAVLNYWRFKQELNLKAPNLKEEIGNRLTVVFGMPIPKSWSKKKKAELESRPHQQKPDIDNLCKAILDCAMIEDSHIYQIKAIKIWSSIPFISITKEENVLPTSTQTEQAKEGSSAERPTIKIAHAAIRGLGRSPRL